MSKVNIVINQGCNFNTVIDLTDENNDPLNVTGYTARSQIRKHYLSINSVSFTTTLSNGQLILSLTPAQTSNIVAGRYVYDTELVDAANSVIRLMEGIATVTPEVTR